MLSQSPLFIGIDLGTSGLRLIALDENGNAVIQYSESWSIGGTTQEPQHWLAALERLWAAVAAQLEAVVALAVTGTSGSVLAVDGDGRAVSPCWLYSDRSGAPEATRLGIPASWGLGRWLWWRANAPEATTGRLAHPTDFLIAALGAPPGITDHTTALKSGFDPGTGRWDRALAVGVPAEQLPSVVRPGTPIGRLGSRWGSGAPVLLVAGCTDGIAAQIAGGALTPGAVCTSLGSTLIFKGVSPARIESADGAVYSHLHPDGHLWLPGAASSCGGAVLAEHFAREHWDALSAAAQPLVPTGTVAYPLSRPGERFPFVAANCAGFLPQAERGSTRFWAGLLEGIACAERLGLERLIALGMPADGPHLTVGGSTRSALWLTIRASILGRALLLPALTEPAAGAAVLAAAGYWGVSVAEAARRLVRVGRTVEPVPGWIASYDSIYQKFKATLNHSLEA
jgi:xylulokinase